MPAESNEFPEQKAGEAEGQGFRNSRVPFAVAAETTRMAMVFTDARSPGHPVIFANDSFLSIAGYSRDEALGRAFGPLIATEDDSETQRVIESEFAGDAGTNPEIKCRRPDGSHFWAALIVSPVHDEAGAIVQHFASLVDITPHKDEEAAATKLIDELNHRMKNTLATVQAIVWQALRSGSDPKTQQEAIQSRLLALSRSHDLLNREGWKGASLRDLIATALEPYVDGKGGKPSVMVSGEDIRFPPKPALALSIAFNELATNAVKYGALSREAGSVSISWTIGVLDDPRPLAMRWEESGGPDVVEPDRRGFGSRMLERGLAQELGGTVNIIFRREGLVCDINMPAP